MNCLHQQFEKSLKTEHLLPPKSQLFIALSGGQDSLCLTKLLIDLQPKWGWKLAIAHCDHGWTFDRGLAEHINKIAKNWGLPFYLANTNNLPETEAAARKWRYQALIELAKKAGFNNIITGHTLSDRAETLLFNLIRGAGTDGLGVLESCRPLSPTINLLRPLLGISRQQTGNFCQKYQLPIWTDIYNQDLRYSRNKIRQELIPLLQQNFNSQVEKHLAQTAQILQADADYLEILATNHLREITDGERIDRYQLKTLPLALKRRVIRQFLYQAFGKMPNFSTIEAIVQLINAPNRSQTASIHQGKAIIVNHQWLEIN